MQRFLNSPFFNGVSSTVFSNNNILCVSSLSMKSTMNSPEFIDRLQTEESK